MKAKLIKLPQHGSWNVKWLMVQNGGRRNPALLSHSHFMQSGPPFLIWDVYFRFGPTFLETYSQTCPKVCLIGDSKSSQVDREN